MINVKKLFKSEGKHKERVKVTRDGKTFYREQMVGRKEKEDSKSNIKEMKVEMRNAQAKVESLKVKLDNISPENKKEIDNIKTQLSNENSKFLSLKRQIKSLEYGQKVEDAIGAEKAKDNIHDVSNQGRSETTTINGIKLRLYGR